MRLSAVATFSDLLDDSQIPSTLLQTMAWSLGEYAYLLEATIDASSVIDKLCAQARKSHANDETRRYIATAVFKLVSHLGTCPGSATRMIDEFTRSRDHVLQQSCLEFQSLMTANSGALCDVLPLDASCEDVGVDDELEVMQGYVDSALAAGARDYSLPPDFNDYDDGPSSESDSPSKAVFNMTPYEKPPTNPHQHFVSHSLSTDSVSTATGSDPAHDAQLAGPSPEGDRPSHSQQAHAPNQGLRLSGVATVWGPPVAEVRSESAPPPPPKPHPDSYRPSQPHPSSLAAPSGSLSSPPPASSPTLPPASDPAPPKELTEKERMAMALFGGVGSSSQVATSTTATSSSSSAAAAAAKQRVRQMKNTKPSPEMRAATEPAATTASPSMDLLDMSFEAPAAASASAPAPALASSLSAPVANSDLLLATTSAAPAAAAVPSAAPVDPFFSSSSSSSSSSAAASSVFTYNSSPMQPLNIDTNGFGQRWGQCKFTKKVTRNNANIKSLDSFMSSIALIGGHPIEAIAKTQEAIAAGVVGGNDNILLFHFKLGLASFDITIKSLQPAIGEEFAKFLQSINY